MSALDHDYSAPTPYDAYPLDEEGVAGKPQPQGEYIVPCSWCGWYVHIDHVDLLDPEQDYPGDPEYVCLGCLQRVALDAFRF